MKSKHICIVIIAMLSLTTITSVASVSEEYQQEVIPLFTIQESITDDTIENTNSALTNPADTLDQQSLKSDNVKKIGGSNQELAQSFTPTYSKLTKVILRLKSTGIPEYQYYSVSIKQSLLGLPIVSTYINRNTLVVGTGWYEFDFTDINVIPENTYYIIIQGITSTGDTSSVYWWYGYPNPYANGAAWYESISGWNYLQAGVDYCDYCFQTYGASGNNPPNTPSQLSGPSSGSVDEQLIYTSSTTDPDDDNVRYNLDVNNDGIYDHTSNFYPSGATYTIKITFYSSGTYYLRLQAEDEYGALSGWSTPKTVTISGSGNSPPNTPTTPTGPTTGTVGISYSYTTSATDPDGDDISYGFDWDGDGIVDEYSSFFSSGTSCTLSHTWNYAGTYEVKVKAKDEHSDLSAFSSPLTVVISDVNNPPNQPSKPTGPSNGKTGITYTYSSSTTDPEGENIYYLFDWGDGTNSGWTGPFTSGSAATEGHSWSSQGTFPVKVKAKDIHDQESPWSESLSVSVPKSKMLTNLYSYLQENYRLFPMLRMILGF